MANHSIAQTKKVNIALAQIFCLDGDREGNFVRIENALKKAKTKDADIVCFPEMAILGWVNPEAHERAFPIPGKDTDRLSELARQYEIFICIGLGEKDGKHLYDSVILIDDQGQVLLKHRKINILTELMTPPYTPGNTVGSVTTRFGKIGLLICADSFDESVIQKMKKEQADFVLIPYGWAKEEADWPEHGLELQKTVQRTAQRLNCPVVGTDLVGEISHGPWKGQVYGGQSLAVDSKGEILAKCADRDSEVKVISLSLE